MTPRCHYWIEARCQLFVALNVPFSVCVQVEVDGEKVEVSGQWNLASPLLPVTINGTERILQVPPDTECLQSLPKQVEVT